MVKIQSDLYGDIKRKRIFRNINGFEYDSSPGVNVDKMFGFMKPKFFSIYNKSVEDFGVMAVDHAIA